MYLLCIQSGRCIFHCIKTTEKLSKLETNVFCLLLYITRPSVIERLSTATFAIFLKITFEPTIPIRQIFEVLKQPLGPQGSVSWGIVRSRNVSDREKCEYQVKHILGFSQSRYSLTHFWPMFPFYISSEHQKTFALRGCKMGTLARNGSSLSFNI